MNQRHIPEETLVQYLTGQLDWIEKRSLETHTEHCHECQERTGLASWSRFLQGKPVVTSNCLAYGECLSPYTLERYLREEEIFEGERILVEQHLNTCEVCRTELEVADYVHKHGDESLWAGQESDLNDKEFRELNTIFTCSICRVPVAKEICGHAAATERSQTLTTANGHWKADIEWIGNQVLLTISVRESNFTFPWAVVWYRAIDSQNNILGQSFVIVRKLSGESGIGEIDLERAVPGLRRLWDSGFHEVEFIPHSHLRQHFSGLQHALSVYKNMRSPEANWGYQTLKNILHDLENM